MSEYPSTKYQRGKVFTKAGLKVGSNYAKHHLKRILNNKNADEVSASNDKKTLNTENANELFKAFTQLRGTALKIAQSLSVDNSGILPDEFLDVMSQAQYQVPPLNYTVVSSILKRELGEQVDSTFESFSKNAIAAASIGQVHQAQHSDHGKMAVKIQYPNVRNTIESDLTMAKSIMKRVVNTGKLDDYFKEIYEMLLKETDYSSEGAYLNHYAEKYRSDVVETPSWIQDLSTEKVLSMTFVEGEHLGEFLKSNPSQEERNYFGQLLWDFFHKQINEQRTIHADAHPGNYKFNRETRTLGVLDFGCVKTFPEHFFNNYMRALPLHKDASDAELRELYKNLQILQVEGSKKGADEAYYDFFKEFGSDFIRPYRSGVFDFGDEDFKKQISHHMKKATSFKEPVGSEQFIYASRVHMGLYNMLMKLRASVDTREAVEHIDAYLSTQN
jgi:predicted unusual protein kinase regulating ubiquinone biosynthesis (AarF/ABC1/UbiB family)